MKIAVIGAGPAGLALGWELAQRGLDFQILEQSAGPADSWRRMPTHLRMVSPWGSNRLPGLRLDRLPGWARVSRARYVDYLAAYAEHHRLPIVANTRVERVERDLSGGFRLSTSGGELSADLVVNATGYFGNPFLPDEPGAAATSIPRLHVAVYREPQHVAGRLGTRTGPVLVVGGRLSAGQTLEELTAAGLEVALSHRGPLRFGPPPLLARLLFPAIPAIERAALALGLDRPDSRARMEWGRARRLLRTGRVARLPAIAAFERDRVRFVDGQRLPATLVIYATGFRPVLSHLGPLLRPDPSGGPGPLAGMESAAAPGLFFLGLDHLRNFRSRFIRGIRPDAALLAATLASRC